MIIIAELLSFLINIAIFIIFAQVVIHWLVMFDVLKVNTFQAKQLVNTLNRTTEKVYGPLRRIIPPLGGIDITPIVVIIGLQLLNGLMWRVVVG
jgi:YggT family protein